MREDEAKNELGPQSRTTLPAPEEIAKEIESVGRDSGIDVSEVIIYGSYARGDATIHSDADVVVVAEFEEDDPHLRRFHWDQSWNYEQYPSVDLLPLRKQEFEELVEDKNSIVSEAAKTGIQFRFD
jgi:predicted nucleotidyltransferase